jgi:cyclophilin family peptidyl-prolyl cis-trans isomerase
MNHAWVITNLLMLACTVGCNRAEPTSSDSSAPVPVESSMGVGIALHTDADPTVVLNTSQGPIKLRLNPAKSPLTVDNFLSQIDNGFYHQTIFHEVTPGFAILAGGVRPDLTEKRGRYSLRNESNNGLSNRRGTIAMARPADGIDSDTGQFFINVADNPALDYQADTPEQCGYCVFGEVVEGMDVVDRIAQLPTHSDGDFPRLPVRAALIESATKAR